MKKATAIFFWLQTLALFSQTIELKYTDFELVTNAKSVMEYKIVQFEDNDLKTIKNAQSLFDNLKAEVLESCKLTFDYRGFVSEHEVFQVETGIQKKYYYNFEGKLSRIEVFDLPNNNPFNYFSITRISRDGDTITKRTKYRNRHDMPPETDMIVGLNERDSIYTEKIIMNNNLIYKERIKYPKGLASYTYNKDNEKISGNIKTDNNKDKYKWTSKYKYYKNGSVLSKKEVWNNGKNQNTIFYFPNGLIQSINKVDKKTTFEYVYDEKGNWIYKIIYANKLVNEVFKREITYLN